MAGPGPLRHISGANAVRREITRQTQEGIVTSIVAGVGQAAQQVERNLTATVQEFGKALSADKLRRRLGPANKYLAEEARREMASAYDRRENIRKNNNYRVGKGYNDRKTGMLLPALKNPAMTANTSERQISFVNTRFLNAETPHWARLNFGAGPNSGQDPRKFELMVEGEGMTPTNLITIGASRTGSPIMTMPKGMWFVPGSMDAAMKGWGVRSKGGSDDWFRPNVAGAFRTTRGIKASNYIDAGFEYLAENTLKRYWDEFLQQAQSARSTLKVRRVDADATFTFE